MRCFPGQPVAGTKTLESSKNWERRDRRVVWSPWPDDPNLLRDLQELKGAALVLLAFSRTQLVARKALLGWGAGGRCSDGRG